MLGKATIVAEQSSHLQHRSKATVSSAESLSQAMEGSPSEEIASAFTDSLWAPFSCPQGFHESRSYSITSLSGPATARKLPWSGCQAAGLRPLDRVCTCAQVYPLSTGAKHVETSCSQLCIEVSFAEARLALRFSRRRCSACHS